MLDRTTTETIYEKEKNDVNYSEYVFVQADASRSIAITYGVNGTLQEQYRCYGTLDTQTMTFAMECRSANPDLLRNWKEHISKFSNEIQEIIHAEISKPPVIQPECLGTVFVKTARLTTSGKRIISTHTANFYPDITISEDGKRRKLLDMPTKWEVIDFYHPKNRRNMQRIL